MQVKIKMFDPEREFNGILVEAQWTGVEHDHHTYRLILRPWLWLLGRTTDCRIFQDMTAPNIIKEVFEDRGFNDYESELHEESSCPKLEYCVQYRETDLNFVTRLMEQHGIYYFFKHEGGKHTLVLADSKSSHSAVPGLASVPLRAATGQFKSDEQHLTGWISERRFRTGKVELNDYNYEKPNAQMVSDAQGSEHYHAFRHGVLRLSGKVQGKIRRRTLREDSASVGTGVGSPQTWSRASRSVSFREV